MNRITHILVSLLCAMHLHSHMLIIGHRGAPGYERENTLPSFQHAVDLGVDMIELDVHTCATGELVVMHDYFVNRTTDGHGKIHNLSLQEIKKLHVGNSTTQVPTLEEVIDVVNRRVPIDIELKGKKTAQPTAKIIKNYLKQGWNIQDFVVSSFDHKQITQFKQRCPKIAAGVLFDSSHKCFNKKSAKTLRRMINVARKHNANFIGLDLKDVSKDLVAQLRDAGYPVYVWTVNDKETADKMRAMGVAGIFSNFPDKV